MKKTLFSYAAVYFLLVFSFIYPVDAGAVIGQRYFGDGATQDPSGAWTNANANDSSCFVCHKPGGVWDAPNKTSYLMTGHRNILRKATVNSFWSGPDGLLYDTDSAGRFIFWNTPGPVSLGTTTTRPPLLDGSCSLWGYPDQSACQSAGGVWTSAGNSLFYLLGGWINAITVAGAYNDPNTSRFAPDAVPNGGSYSCARCHTTGMTLDTAVSTTRPPARTYPGINGYVNFDPDGNGPATTVSWAAGYNTGQTLEGIQCERCHDATRHSISGPTVAKGVKATALCLQCHRQEHTETYTGGGLGANIHPTPSTDNTVIAVSEPTYSLPAIEVGRSDGSYGRVFFGYSTGMEYLNSVHSRFTGTFQQINDVTRYNSGFSYGSCNLSGYTVFDQYECEDAGGSWTDPNGCAFSKATCEVNAGTWTVLQGGCTTCHDVHNSLFVASQKEASLKKRCSDCHVNNAATGASEVTTAQVASFNHPAGSNTPFDAAKYAESCVVCHMATQAQKNGDQNSMPVHVWRINTDVTYDTFPTVNQFNGTGGVTQSRAAQVVPEAYVKTDGTAATYAKAVWVDLDLACGQCHGGSLGTAATHNDAPYFTKAQLSTYAPNMHKTRPTASFTWNTDATPDYSVSFTSTSFCLSGATCTYTWDFGDGSAAASGPAAAHVYANSTPRTAVLTMVQNAIIVETASAAVSPKYMAVNKTLLTAPTASANGLSASVTWSVSGGIPGYTVSVVWGDGASQNVIQPAAGAGLLSHTYVSAKTYTVSVTATDSGDNGSNATSASGSTTVTVTAPVVSGTVMRLGGITPVAGATVTLKQNGVIKKMATTAANGTYSVTGVLAGVYDVYVVKSGVTFASPAAAAVSVSADTVVNITATN